MPLSVMVMVSIGLLLTKGVVNRVTGTGLLERCWQVLIQQRSLCMLYPSCWLDGWLHGRIWLSSGSSSSSQMWLICLVHKRL